MKALFQYGRGAGVVLSSILFLALGLSPTKGQGVQVIFSNRTSSNPCGGAINAPVFGVQGQCFGDALTGNATTNGGTTTYLGSLLAGTGYSAGLFAGPEGAPEASLVQIGHTTFRTGAAAGYISPQTVTVPWLTPGTRPAFQVRAWDNRGFTVTSWSQALASGSFPIGSSALFSPECPVPPEGVPQTIYLTGLTSFNLWLPTWAPYWVRSFTTNVVVASGGIATLAADVWYCKTGGTGVTQQWRRAGMALPGATSSMLVLNNVSAADAGIYVFAIGHTNEFTSMSQTFTVRLLIPPRITGIQFSPPRTATLTYETGPDAVVAVEGATSLAASNWATLITAPFPGGQFQDHNATNQARHYRLRLLQ